jgi:hypothetical protein
LLAISCLNKSILTSDYACLVVRSAIVASAYCNFVEVP